MFIVLVLCEQDVSVKQTRPLSTDRGIMLLLDVLECLLIEQLPGIVYGAICSGTWEPREVVQNAGIRFFHINVNVIIPCFCNSSMERNVILTILLTTAI